MPDFNYWLMAVSGGAPYMGWFNRYSSYSAAMSEARRVKFLEPSFCVVVEVLRADEDHPDIDLWPDEFQRLRRS
jgi:hypothetical protein